MIHPEDAEYTTLRTEIMHYDKACLTILGFLLVLSTSVYGLVAEKGTFSLLLLLSIIWSVGFRYILDKRLSILRIALYLQVCFESSDRGFWWESWLTKDGVRLHQKCKGVNHSGLKTLPARDPIYLEFFLLFTTLVVNVIWIWMLSADRAQVTSLTVPNDPQLTVRVLAILTTIFFLISSVWNWSLVIRYRSFKKQEYFDACKSQNED